MEWKLGGAFLIIPGTGSPEVGDGAVLPSAAVVGFALVPVALGGLDFVAVVPGPFALMSGIRRTNPLQLFWFWQRMETGAFHLDILRLY